MPCEVRFIRLPSSKQRLIRASILDNAARRQADTLAYGERRVLELVAANAPLEKTLLAVVRLIEQLHPGVSAAITLLDADAGELSLAAANGLSARVTELLAKLPVGLRSGSCGVAASLGRQVVVRDVASDPLWAELASVAVANGVRACCSTPIITAGDRVHGTLALYFDTVRGPNTEELDLVTRLTQLAGIAIRRKQDETRAARQRGAFPGAVRQRRRRRLPGGAGRRALVGESGARANARPRGWRGARPLQHGGVLRGPEGARAPRQRARRATAASAISSISCARVRAASSSSSRTRGS